MLQANRALRALSLFASPGRLGRPLTYFRLPGMSQIDSVLLLRRQRGRPDRLAVLRLHARGPGPGRLPPARSLPPVRPHALGRRPRSTTSRCWGRVKTPTLLVAGEADIISDIPSTELTYQALGQPRQDADEVRQSARPGGRLRPLRPRLEPPRAARGLPAGDRLARPAPAGPCPPRSGRPSPPPVASDPGLSRVPSSESMQICDQVSNSVRSEPDRRMGRKPASASPSSRGATSGRSSS